ncbi:ArpU family phage packaging/lysis transcriptional regulator [Bacillus sp. Cs-700]|uniref:ArpU family phage packaging/lysis transcriptional regulator n=1 Tax=Bacillus sp. Cs-700 TaxID=2589818 RepID=UPI001409F99A|nr:ArpU family phage packaging/lysis transcriptional regulator [Bacillus sp. Cs-700]
MAKQIDFNLPEIDRLKTKAAVERALEKHTIYLLMDPYEHLPKVTQTFSIVPPSHTNEFNSSNENAAIKNIDQAAARGKYLSKIRKAVNRLSFQERSIIIQRYMNEEDVFDYEVYNELGMSERKYYRVKARAFYKLAFILHIEVTKEKVFVG